VGDRVTILDRYRRDARSSVPAAASGQDGVAPAMAEMPDGDQVCPVSHVAGWTPVSVGVIVYRAVHLPDGE
jgi:hypothetical protein